MQRSSRVAATLMCASFMKSLQLRATTLSEELFAAPAMVEVQKDLMSMKVPELKAELAAREEPTTGAKAWLRQRLHAALVRRHLADDE